MKCKEVELEMPEGYKRDVTVCDDVKLPTHIKGATNKTNLILISEYLDDLGIPYPELYVWIHESNHVKYPRKSEYEIRRMSDREYERKTGIKIDTTSYFNYIKNLKNLQLGFD